MVYFVIDISQFLLLPCTSSSWLGIDLQNVLSTFSFNQYLLNTAYVITADLVARKGGDAHIWKGEGRKGDMRWLSLFKLFSFGVLHVLLETLSPILLILCNLHLNGADFPKLMELTTSSWHLGNKFGFREKAFSISWIQRYLRKCQIYASKTSTSFRRRVE